MKLAGICLLTRDVLALADFYTKALNTEATGDAGHTELPAASLAIFPETGMEEMAPGSTRGIGRGSAILEFQVDDVDADYERILALGATVIKPPQTHPWGSRAFWFLDPDGNIVDFFQKL